MKKIFALILCSVLMTACAGREHIMSEQMINTAPEMENIVDTQGNYYLVKCKMNDILEMSEGQGVRHDLFFENYKLPFGGFKVEQDDGLYLYIPIPGGISLNYSRAVITSRSGERLYPLDGGDPFDKRGIRFGMFSWEQIDYLNNTDVIVEKINVDSTRHRDIVEMISAVLDNAKSKIPTLFDQVVDRLARVSSNELEVAVTTDFSNLFLMVGMRVWSIADILTRKADLSLAYYDTAPAKKIDIAIAITPVKRNVEGVVKSLDIALDSYKKDRVVYKKSMEQYRADRQSWLKKQ